MAPQCTRSAQTCPYWTMRGSLAPNAVTRLGLGCDKACGCMAQHVLARTVPGVDKKRFPRGGSLEPLSETSPRFKAPVTGTIPTPNPANGDGTYVQPHPMAQRKVEDVAPHLGLPLAQTTRMQTSTLTHQRNWNRKQT